MIREAELKIEKRIQEPKRKIWTRNLLGKSEFFTGLIVKPSDLESLPPKGLDIILDLSEGEGIDIPNGVIILSEKESFLLEQRTKGHATCLYVYVVDAESLHRAIESGKKHDYLIIRFKDPTNIPLELVIASLQSSGTVLIKEIARGDIDDAVVTLGVMEMGADGILFTPRSETELTQMATRIAQKEGTQVELQVATVTKSLPVGMGYRSCIDLATMFTETEGMVVGSTSQGGILCCPEVFYLPYMELRPFRVNAGGIHSYVYNHSNRTDYMTELKGGSPVMIVGHDGETRTATVGRMKTEIRPLRLIEAEFDTGERVSVMLQDDWHVRIYSDEGKPLNITEVKPGTKVMALLSTPGRHVGIAVKENILEN